MTFSVKTQKFKQTKNEALHNVGNQKMCKMKIELFIIVCMQSVETMLITMHIQPMKFASHHKQTLSNPM
jgi:hypothetical protein